MNRGHIASCIVIAIITCTYPDQSFFYQCCKLCLPTTSLVLFKFVPFQTLQIKRLIACLSIDIVGVVIVFVSINQVLYLILIVTSEWFVPSEDCAIEKLECP